MSNKLLLADDSITIQKVVGIIFANEDYELTVVDNGDAALEKAKQIVPDIILVDALMPGKNGYEVCAGVRQDPRLKGIPLLLMTGAFEPFDEDKARQSGADDFISKPFESQQLIDRVKKLIDLGRERIGTPATMPMADEIVPAGPALASPAAPTTPVTPDLSEAFAAEPVVNEPPEEVFALDETAVEGNVDDDLWGAFDLDDVSSSETADFGVVVDTPPAATPVTTPVDDAFSFADVNDDLAENSVVAEQQFETGWEPVEEKTFDFPDEEQAEVGQPVELGFAEEPTELETVHEVAEPVFETVSPFEEDTEIETFPASAPSQEPAAVSVAPETAPQAEATVTAESAGAAPAITQEQLVAALQSLSRDVIEKIVWEVVPDLAEALIKEEIRKLKGGTGN